MRIKATRPVLAAGAGRTPGETFDADEDEATRLVWLGWAEKADDEGKADDDAGKKQTRRAKGRS